MLYSNCRLLSQRCHGRPSSTLRPPPAPWRHHTPTNKRKFKYSHVLGQFLLLRKKHFRSFWAVDPIRPTINTGLYGLSTDGVFIQWVLSLTYLSSTTSSTKMLQIDTLLKPMVRFNRGLGKSVRTLPVSFDMTVASRLCGTS